MVAAGAIEGSVSEVAHAQLSVPLRLFFWLSATFLGAASTMLRAGLAFATLAAADAYRFMAIGDWGASYTPPKSQLKDTCAIDPAVNCSTHGVSGCGYNEQQQMDGLQMGKFAAANKVDHVMLLGDNFVSCRSIDVSTRDGPPHGALLPCAQAPAHGLRCCTAVRLWHPWRRHKLPFQENVRRYLQRQLAAGSPILRYRARTTSVLL